MLIDVIVISNAATDKLRKLTNDCILSLLKSEMSHTFNIIVVEQQPGRKYHGATILEYSGPFHYNACLNLGIQQGTSRWVVAANNDLLFNPGWFTAILEQYKATGIESWGSVSEPFQWQARNIKATDYQKGYRIGIELTGWCITLKRSLWKKIGGFGTTYTFHYSDYEYAEQLLAARAPHALAVRSKVTHLLSQTIALSPAAERLEYVTKNRQKYERLCKERGFIRPEIYNPNIPMR